MTLRKMIFDCKILFSRLHNYFSHWKIFFLQHYKRWLLVFFGASIFLTWYYAFARPFFTPLMTIRSVNNIFHRESPLRKHNRVPIEDISSSVIYAVIAAEDNKFVDHFWFDIEAIQKAIKYNFSHEWSLIGGSTISQQTAKNVFLWPGRDIFRKWFEVYFTLLIESMWTKERIMEIYLNSIEFWNWIYGIDAAAKQYFHTSAKKLTNYQASLLAALLPNPRYYQNHLRSYVLQRRRNAILYGITRMKNDKETRLFVNTLK